MDASVTSPIVTISHWSARRAGGRITINGINVETGESLKVVGVDTIAAGADAQHPVAIDKNNVKYLLA